MSSLQLPPPELSSRAPDLDAAVAAAAASLAAGPSLPTLPPKASPTPRPAGPINAVEPAVAAPTTASSASKPARSRRRLLTLVACVVALGAGAAVVQLVRRATDGRASAAPASTVSTGGATVDESGLHFRLPARADRTTVELTSALPGATDVKWSLRQGQVLTTVQFLQLPTAASAAGGDRFARAVLAAILRLPRAQITVTERPTVEGAVARYYEVGYGTHMVYVYTVVKDHTVVTLVSTGGDGTSTPAAFSMARATLEYQGAALS
ncbi:MAG: hypothetical protein WCI22_12280 [Actinomycetota bacterium]